LQTDINLDHENSKAAPSGNRFRQIIVFKPLHCIQDPTGISV